ncbi:MAG: RNA-binding domain-containing protein [Gammaproteobacteria bacterium]
MNISCLLKSPEGKTLEFKRDLSSVKPILKTLVAFANTAGGVLVLGVDDDKKIIGIEDPLLSEEKLTSLIADHISPTLLPTIKIAAVNNKSLLLIEVQHVANAGPFYLKQEGREKGVMVRLGSSSQVATLEMIQELQRIRQAHSFDAAPCPQASYEDLDQTLLKQLFESAGQPLSKAKLKTLKILVPYGKQDVPSNAGVILFAKCEVREQLFPMAYVSCARFAGTEKVDFIDQLDIGRVIEAVSTVPAFIRRNTRMGAVIKEIKRKDIPEYPSLAIREGLLNALMHADYSYSGMRIFVSIFDDRLEIRSPGCLPPGMTIDSLKEGISIPRNLVIARIFKMFNWVEQFGTGYFRIKQACEKGNYPIPEWREVGPYTDIIFKPMKMESIHDLSHGKGSGTRSASGRH